MHAGLVSRTHALAARQALKQLDEVLGDPLLGMGQPSIAYGLPRYGFAYKLIDMPHRLCTDPCSFKVGK